MQTFKPIGIGVASLAALATEGKDFDRAELNAMLDKLAASPEPKVRIGPLATCYVVGIPRPEVLEYVCKKCGTHTVYPKNTLQMKNVLSRCRDGAASLRALGLDITLDESVLCSKCHSAKELDIPIRGKIVNPVPNMDFSIGEEVAIISHGLINCKVASLSPDRWISAQYISETGEVLGSYVNIRLKPNLGSSVIHQVYKGTNLERQTPRPGDPEKWVRIRRPSNGSDHYWPNYDAVIPTDCLGEFTYDEKDCPSLKRMNCLAWVINGKRSIVKNNDIEILRAFLRGDKTRHDQFGEKIPLKSDLPRLKVLLGSDVEPVDKRNVEVEVDI